MNKRWIKETRGLQLKKNRKKSGLFIVEGRKSVLELMNSDIQLEALFYTQKYAEEFESHHNFHKVPVKEVSTETALTQAGSLKVNDAAIAVAHIPQEADTTPENEIVLALDDVRDPGNLGTIIRIADWYGIKKIICSHESADVYNPKVISATMGSFTRIQVSYVDLPAYLDKHQSLPIYGAFMEGENIYQTKISAPAIVVMGNESNGISEVTSDKINKKITIPRIGQAESLNVAIATAIICDNVARHI
ncbi:RNA methyltransferase [Limibacter armeniacum]|uniref:TrmH family RNA methyltransferase n=1 Tax=Limibacter armeniacum TaxID=466084 RepID=UPI002FE5CAC4